MLDKTIIKNINDFVYQKPRTIQEIAFLINKNWRTADAYVDKIVEQEGTLAVRTFRGGTRGALKIVYWANIEKIHSSEFQEKLFKRIEQGKRKHDFSAFDIYQYVEQSKRNAFLEELEGEKIIKNQGLAKFLNRAEKQIFSFSGNLSWINLIENNRQIIKIVEELAGKGIDFKVLTRVDLAGLKNTQNLLAINHRIKREAIEIRHCEQPLRCFIIDDKIARLKEIKDPSEYKKGELDEKAFILYEIFDEEWVAWLQKVFWNFFRTAIPAEKRLKDIETIRKIKAA